MLPLVHARTKKPGAQERITEAVVMSFAHRQQDAR